MNKIFCIAGLTVVLVMMAVEGKAIADAANPKTSNQKFSERKMWIDVRDFAPADAKTDGKFDWNSKENPYIQNAIDSITKWEYHGPNWGFGFGTVFFPAGTFKTSQQIRLPGGIRVVGSGKKATIILGEHSGVAVINMRGASECSLENLQIKAKGTKTGLLLGRSFVPNINVAKGIPNPGGKNYFVNVVVTGTPTIASVYSIASEENLWERCTFRVDPEAKARHAFYTSRRDDLKVDDKLAECVNTVHTFISCTFNNARGPVGDDHEKNDALYINASGIQYALFVNCYFVTGSGCWIRIKVEDTYRGPIHFIGCGNEKYGAAPKHGLVKAGIIIEAPGKNNPTYDGLVFDNSSFSFQANPAVLVTDPMTLKNFRYNHISSNAGNCNLKLSSLINSEIKINNGKVIISGNARNNLLTGPVGSFDIKGTDIGNIFRDTSSKGLHGSRSSILACTKNYAIKPFLSGAVLTNRGAKTPVTFKLPPASPGLH